MVALCMRYLTFGLLLRNSRENHSFFTRNFHTAKVKTLQKRFAIIRIDSDNFGFRKEKEARLLSSRKQNLRRIPLFRTAINFASV